MRARRSTLTLTLLTAAGILLAGCTLLPGGSVLAPTTSAPADDDDVYSIRVGDCLNDADLSEVVETVPIVPCSEPHDSEAYFAADLPDGDFPGEAAVQSAAEETCGPPFEVFVGLPDSESDYTYTYYYPTPGSWEDGDREILCVAYSGDLKRMTGTIEGIGR